MEEEKRPILRTFFEELKDGNPFIILGILMILVMGGSIWVWQTTHNPGVNTPTPRFSHPNAISPVQVLTARALTGIAPQATPTVVATPAAVVFPLRKIYVSDSRISYYLR